MNNNRFHFLDVLRGLAIAGILLVNAPDLVRLGSAHPAQPPAGRTLLDLTVQSRLVPIFAVLFGVTMWLMVDGARRRGRRPGPALVLRMAGLGAIGLLHSLAFSGDILREYAVVGLLLIPFALWAAPWLSLTLGLVATAVSFGLFNGGVESLPGLMLIGLGCAGLGVPAFLERRGRPVAWALAAALPVAALAIAAQVSAGGGDPRFVIEGARAGLATAVVYVLAASLAWQWAPARAVLSACFTALGRAALTCYVSASVVFAGLAHSVDFTGDDTVWRVLGIAVAVLAVQALLAAWWLRHFTGGPLEWLLRAVTWWSLPPLRRGAHRRPASAREADLRTVESSV